MSRGAVFRSPTSLRSRAMFNWNGRDSEDTARTGQALVFSRSDSAWGLTTEGKVYRIQEDQPRWAYHETTGKYGLLLEATAATNVVSQPSSFASWTGVNTPSRYSQVLDMGVLKLDYLIDDSASLQEYYSLAVTVTAAVQLVSLFASRGATSQSGQITFVDSGATTRLDAQIDWTAGGVPSFTMTTGTSIAAEKMGSVKSPLGYDVYRISMKTTSCAAGAGTLTVRPVKTAASVGQMYAGGVQVEADGGFGYPSSYVNGNLTHAQEFAYWSLGFTPRELTWYAEFINLGAANGAYTPFQMGYDGGGTPINGSVRFVSNGTAWSWLHKQGGSDAGPSVTLMPTYGQRCELRGVLSTGGVSNMTLGVSVNGGAESTTTGNGQVALDAAWGADRLYAGHGGGLILLANKVLPGIVSMADCRVIQ
jgi:hypothetical protein